MRTDLVYVNLLRAGRCFLQMTFWDTVSRSESAVCGPLLMLSVWVLLFLAEKVISLHCTNLSFSLEDPRSPQLVYKWCNIGVLDYDEEKKLFLVQKSRDTQLQTPNKMTGPSCQYWVPRLRLLFCAENPRVFAQRIVAANRLRKKTEALLLYNLYIDCMPGNGQKITAESLGRMKQRLLSTARLKQEDGYDTQLCLFLHVWCPI